MKNLIFAFLAMLFVSPSYAAHLADSDFFEYEVLFTNPVCEEYKYTTAVISESGNNLVSKPKDVYCRYSDSEASRKRENFPEARLIEWIKDVNTKEIFFAYLSFSNSVVRSEICKAVKERGVKVTFVLDNSTALTEATELQNCSTPEGGKPELVLRGLEGGLGYAHNKLFIVNPNSSDKIRIVFSSGNLTSGVVLHHENWNFITTSVASNFAQAHLCLMQGMLNHGRTLTEYVQFIQSCRRAIKAPAETDVQTFFVPGEGELATRALDQNIRRATDISVAAHRFSYYRLLEMLNQKLRTNRKAKVRMVHDDDTYWVGTTGVQVGSNLVSEYRNVERLVNLGAEARYMQTNHQLFLLHHNKFLVFDDKAVFTGAGNLTGEAFNRNFENFYLVTIPHVAKAYRTQYEHLWKNLATAPADMPTQDVHP
jgi:hypothetical protein